MAPSTGLPVLIAGDVHGDIERLFTALKPYPPHEWRTIFLGDLVDYGMFGVGALRYARDRANSEIVLGNHEIALLWALRDPSRIGFWAGIGGQPHDLEELRKDEPLQEWMKTRPLMLRLEDGTLVQHSGNDAYLELAGAGEPRLVEKVNARARELLRAGGEEELWLLLSSPNVFETQPSRLERWLELTRSRRVVFGHKPHGGAAPGRYHGGKALNFDGGLSRAHRLYRKHAPVAASVGPLDHPW